MGIRQLPSGSFQVRFQLHGVSHAATYPTRDMAEEAGILIRADALSRRYPFEHEDNDDADPGAPHLPRWQPDPSEVTASSAEAAAVIDAVFANFDSPVASDEPPDALLTTGQAAALLGVSRPTVVAWVEAGRIPCERRGTHRRLRTSVVLAYMDGLSAVSDDPEADVNRGSC